MSIINDNVDLEEVGKVIRRAKVLAKKYYALTGRPLGITGEVAEYEASRLLGLQLMPARHPRCDAIRKRGKKSERLQIKGRRVINPKGGQRMGSISLKKPWDAVLLVMLDDDFEPTAIYEANRHRVSKALLAPGSKARNERGALSVSKFVSTALGDRNVQANECWKGPTRLPGH